MAIRNINITNDLEESEQYKGSTIYNRKTVHCDTLHYGYSQEHSVSIVTTKARKILV